jgi:hypothetical protein
MGAFERSLNFLVVNRRADPSTNVRGVLGEDYLRNFDIYIDYRRQLIQLEPSPGVLGNTLAGERLPLGLYGSRGEKIASNRLVIEGQFLEFGNNDSVLEIDSGAPYLLLCSPVIRLGISNIPRIFEVTGALGGSFAATSQAAHLRLGKKELFSNVIVPKDDLPFLNVDGFLPTSLFRSIFISHSGRFVILDPSPTTALAEPKPRSL